MDAVIAYVDGMEPNWRFLYNRHIGGFDFNENRFTDYGTLRFVLRGISEHMSFINRVFLIVSSLEQVPEYVNDNVIIITHDQFIPSDFLPTFNANTIEAFLWNIPDLGEEFIYFNDDMIPIGHLNREDFFINGMPCLNFRELKTTSSEFNSLIETDNMFAFTFGEKPRVDHLWTHHIMTPYLKSSYYYAFDQRRDTIKAFITPIRRANQFSQHYFSNYFYYTDTYVNHILDYCYFNTRCTQDEFCEFLDNNKTKQALCLNDYGPFFTKSIMETKKIIYNELIKILPNKGKYEKQ